MATQRIVIDPITRIEGHLRIELETDGGMISNARACTTQFRGIEKILQGRDPRDAWALVQRICGVCTGVHAVASIRAVEDSLKYQVPRAAELIRALMIEMGTVQDHVIHFYHLHAMDWVDVISATKADPVQTARLAGSLSDWPTNSAAHFSAVRKNCRSRLREGGYSCAGVPVGPLKPGIITDGDITRLQPFDHNKIAEFVTSSWYAYPDGDEVGRHPWEGKTNPRYTGQAPPYRYLSDDKKYTWCKAPRYDGKAMQVGPNARLLTAYAQGHAATVTLLNNALGQLVLKPVQLNYTLGEVVAR